ncbi:ABC transporter permease subunit [Enterobacter sp. CC120223-11]|uniref:ABC transporter permease subunit n=1 Tax=Enterobacter sp. CC120223-11 TaxID=1378073 RepID=UPI000BD1DF99|nr:ABC transporter permease subunit [Enterobacter sp. CC120223-11]SNY59664.1 putative thiamine transport system permease protein [Enterobacter sp. CC120223-11]
MAAPLRYTLTGLLWAAMGLIYLPLLPAAVQLFAPAFSSMYWQVLLDDPQLPQAALATLISTLIALIGALSIALCVVSALWPSRLWQQLATRLPLLLAVPHVAFASAAWLLFAEGGWLFRQFPGLTPPVDRYGVGLGLTLAVKESVFLLWTMYALLGEKRLAEQSLTLRSQGFGRWQCLAWVVVPQLLPQLRIVLLATTAWTLSAVDVALILGPGNPPTLAVLAWQWLSQGDELQQAKGALACLLLLLLLAALILLAQGLWRLYRTRIPDFRGIRHPGSFVLPGKALAVILPLLSLLCVTTLALLANREMANADSIGNSLGLALGSTIIGGVLCLLWQEFGAKRFTAWIWLPLVLPALPLASGQYQLALLSWQDGEWLTVLWGHLLWVMPWMLFILQPAWQRLDPRLTTIARTLGWGRWRCFWRVKCPLLLRPLLAALAVGFSVSITQYLPTLWLGAGRVATLTTDAVALSSGGSTPMLATQALWQLLLPGLFFLAIALLLRLVGHYRQGLR